MESALAEFDSSQAAQLTLKQRVAELEGQLSGLADATTQTELDLEGLFDLEDGLLQEALGGAQDAPAVEQHNFESDSEIMIIDENSFWQKDSEGIWRERERQPTV